MDFETAFERLVGHEGGFTKDPADPGNWTGGKVGVGVLKGTKFGIAANTYPDMDIENLTLGEAKAIYLRDFWQPLQTDRFPSTLRFDLFDTAVNSGGVMAARMLQRAVGVNDDGKIGPKTLGAVGVMDPQLLDKRFSGQRLLFLTDLKNWKAAHRGWAKRIARNLIED